MRLLLFRELGLGFSLLDRAETPVKWGGGGVWQRGSRLVLAADEIQVEMI